MNFTSKILMSLILVLTFTSCEDAYLDRQDDGKLQEAEVFNKIQQVEQLVDQLYTDMYSRSRGFDSYAGHNIGTLCDELEFNKADNDEPFKYVNGEMSADPASISSAAGYWWLYYQSIRKANKIIWGVDFYKTPDHASRPGLIKQLVAQARFFMVYYHYMVLRQHGEMCYLDRVVQPSEVPATYAFRESVHTSIDKMCAALDLAANDLPIRHSGNDFNRIDKGACLSLKAILRYIAASPLYNGGINGMSALGTNDTRVAAAEYKIYDSKRWEAARDAAAAVVGTNGLMGSRYLLFESHDNLTYIDDLGNISASENKVYARLGTMFRNVEFYQKESILTLQGGKDTRWIGDNIINRTFSGQSRNQPTQAHVDNYEIIIGDIGYGIFSTDGAVVYDDANPYVNRDPRFYRDVMYAGCTYQNIVYQPHEGGLDALLNSTVRDGNVSRTGYSLRKFIYEDWVLTDGIGSMLFPLIRLPEIMLIYAEALNETGGDVATIATMLNEIRARSFMAPVPSALFNGSKELRAEYIDRERRVELFFENNRFYNLRYKALPTSENELSREGAYLAISSDGDQRAINWVKNGNGSYPMTQKYVHGMRPVPDPTGQVSIEGAMYRMERFEGKQLVRKFTYRDYYFPINSNEIAKTPTLVQNPGW